uniref:hypothetical protein n=1 Tax=Rhodopseudomonas palustris TaxID=1076 RepID=UPI000641BC3F
TPPEAPLDGRGDVYLFLIDMLVNVDFCRLAAGALPLRVSSPVAAHALRELVSILRQTLEVPMDVAIIPSREQIDRIEQAKAQLQALGFKDHQMQRVARVSAAIRGVERTQESRVSLRSPGRRLLHDQPGEAWAG